MIKNVPSKIVLCIVGAQLSSMVAYAASGDEYVPVVPPVVVYDEEFSEEYDDGFNDSDPLESFNRTVYRFNDTLDDYLLSPVAEGYRAVVPEYGRNRVSNILSNLTAPVSFANNLLQGEFKRAGHSFWRFVINSTIGIGGFNDVATEFGIPDDKSDFGVTLAKYGVESGPYIVLPLLGPTTVRDGFGGVVDIFASPVTYSGTAATITYRASDTVSGRERLLDLTKDIDENSFDPYASIRSSYLQNRAKKIKNASGEQGK